MIKPKFGLNIEGVFMKKTNYSIKKLFKKGIATLLTASMVVTAVQAPAFADNVDEEVTESTASVSGLVRKKITLELVSDELKEAALTAIRENRLFDAQDYLAATGDNQKALREYEAFFNENPGLYVVDAPESVVDTLSGEDAELRIFVQKDAKMAKVDLTATPSEITREDSTESKNVEFRYGTDKDIILYEPASNVDTLVNGGEDAYYIEPEQEIGDNSDYELTGNEKITFMFVNASDSTVKFTLKVDGVAYDKVEVGGREAALKKIIAEAGTKKSTEETTAAETTVAETTAVTAVTEETTVADETTAAEVKEEETEAPAEDTTAEGTEIANADADNTSADTEETTAAVEETAAETEAPAADTDAEVKEEAPAEVTEEPETEATIPEKIAEAISEAFGGASDAVLGRMTVYADTIVGEGVEFEVEENAPAAGDSEEAEDKDTNEAVAQAVEAAAGEDTATEADEVNEETTAAVEEAADDNTALAADTTALQVEVSEGLSEDEAENRVEETVAQEVTVVETEPETVAETQAVKETIAKDDETKAAKVATASEIAEYDDFALELIAEVKEEVLQDKAAAKENIKVARIAQYTINELGKIHYETEVDGFNVEVFAAKNAFGDITPTLEAKKLAKPEEAEASEEKLSDDQVAELKANNIYDNSQSLDIHFVDGFGKEVEPSETVKVRITLSDENLLKTIDASSLEVHHLKETNDTLKTEKVAATEDVKLLDANDEQITDSDLEANAEAVAAGEEAEVKAVSAVAEFEVESFSIFAIVWKSSVGTVASFIRAYYVDKNGNQILDNSESSNIYLGSSLTLADAHGEPTISFSDVQGGVTNYKFKEARLGSVDGQVVTSVKQTDSKETGSTVFLLDYYNGSDMVARNTVRYFDKAEDDQGGSGEYGETLYYKVENGANAYRAYDYSTGWGYYKILGDKKDVDNIYTFEEHSNWTEAVSYTGKRYTFKGINSDNTIYFVYEPVNYQPGGDSTVVDLGAPAANKTLKDNEDGTYTLTLSVTGKSQYQEDKIKANVVVVFDLSNSMEDEASSEDTYEPSNYGNYYLENGEYKKLKYKYEWKEQVGHYEGHGWNRHWVHDYDITHTEYRDLQDANSVDTVYDRSNNLYTGQRYSLMERGTRLDVAKSAVKSLATTLLANNTEKYPDAVELGLITFGTKTSVYTPQTNADDFNAVIDSLTVDGGTNWEGGLLDANGYSFGIGDDDPVYVIFVSDGKPTFRVNANAYTEDDNSVYCPYYDVHGSGKEGDENVGRCKTAAVKAATALLGANKKLYTVNAFSGEGANGAMANMKALFGTNTSLADSNYHNAINQKALNEAFGKIIKEIEHDLAYTNVEFIDGISDLTATMEVLGTTGNYTYEITKEENGEEVTVYDDAAISADDNLKKIRTAGFSNGTVTWDVGGQGYRLADGLTYKVSFVVWPKQEAYDMLADAGNGKKTDAEMAAAGFVKENGNWVYKTNTGATVSYQTVNVEIVDGHETTTTSGVKTSSINVYPTMKLTDTKLSYVKEWKLDNPSQSDLFTHDVIKINLQRKNSKGEYVNYFAEPFELGGEGTNIVTSSDGKLITWSKEGSSIDIAPGILVSEAIGNTHEFNKEGSTAKLVPLEGTNSKYYIVETGHDYRFDEKVGNESFELEEIIYHPMVVDGTLKNVVLSYDDSGEVTSIKSIDDGAEFKTLTATNVVKLDKLKVYKTYTGNMAVAQKTTFNLKLYTDEAGTTAASYNDIELLNPGDEQNHGAKLTKVSDGVYEFTITPGSINDEAYVEITLPAKAIYKVEEVKDGKAYADYKTKWGTASGAETNENSLTTAKKLSEVHSIYFVNEKKIDTPTGYRDNAYPFVALALAGLASMVFLAYDFQKRRLFED